AAPEAYALSLHDALPISAERGTKTGSPYSITMRLKGFGTRKRSQLFIHHPWLAPAVVGITGTPAIWAASRSPGFILWRGPRGPSGVIAIAVPCFSTRTISRSAALPPRELDPRTARYPHHPSTTPAM